MRPKFLQALARVAVYAAKALPAHVTNRGAHDIEGDTRSSEFLAYRKTLELYKISEVARSKAASGLAVDEADEMRRHPVVAVEFLCVRAGLFREVHCGAN